jgi:hypothetical protein
MGARAAQLVRQEFNLELTVARYVAAYNELLDRPGPGIALTATQGAGGVSLGKESFT